MKKNRINTIKNRLLKRFLPAILVSAFLFQLSSCDDYLNVVPDNMPSMDKVFANKKETEKFLYTCYSWLPDVSLVSNILLIGADDTWTYEYNNYSYQWPWKIALGEQNVVTPYMNAWEGGYSGKSMFQAIRDCNTFLENLEDLDKISDLDLLTRKRWIAEAKFLKAYYHFYLFRMYGPIPITDKNLSTVAPLEEVHVKRNTVDDVVKYISGLLDEATSDLPMQIDNLTTEAGRITKAVSLTLKARLLVTAACPLFNGNKDYATFKDKDGVVLFNQTEDPAKWELALQACEDALNIPGYSLYEFTEAADISPTTRIQMRTRGVVTEKWNSELIWGLSRQNTPQIQSGTMVPQIDPKINRSTYLSSYISVTLSMAERFYSKNGVPIEEDKNWDYANRYKLAVAGVDQAFNVQHNYTTANLNLYRENRYYASIAFDGGLWYLNSVPDKTDKNAWTIKAKLGQLQGRVGSEYLNVTGFWIKKLVNKMFVQTEQGCTTEQYPWPEMRLSDLYLLYAEALNEVGGDENMKLAIHYLDLIREKAGLPGVEYSWTNFSKNPNKFKNQEGLREIIHQEREIELAFEGQRQWDLRRWKRAHIEMNKPVQGWYNYGKTAEDYYKVTTLYYQQFIHPRDYLWPISEKELLENPNLVQNPGW